MTTGRTTTGGGATSAVHLERERTYDLPDGVGLPDLAALAAGLDVGVFPAVAGAQVRTDRYALRTVYLDTEDLRLASAGITLRRREGGADDGWHVKLPLGGRAGGGAGRGGGAGAGDGPSDAPGDSRLEVHRPLTSDETPPPDLLRLVRARTGDATVGAVVRLAVDRHVRRLLTADGSPLVELADDRVAAARGGTERGDADEPRAWREVELELLEGDPALLDALDAALRAAGLRPADSASKLARALDLAPWHAHAAPRRHRRASAGQVLADHLAAQVEDLRSCDPLVRLGDPGAVHDARVAVRRLRSALRTHRRLLARDAEVLAGLDEELAWLGDALGVARDVEVLRGRFAPPRPPAGTATGAAPDAGPDAPALVALDAALRREERPALAALAAALDDDRHDALLARLGVLVADPPWRGRARRRADRVLPALVDAELDRALTRLDRALAHPAGAGRDDALHAARRAARRLRYAAETGGPALGRTGRRVARRAHALQRVLGDHHDAVVARERIAALASVARTPRGTAFALGRLHAQEGARAAAAEAALPAARRALRRLRAGPASG